MCVHVHSLPDDCLLPVFDRIPLLELLRLDQVCQRWASLFPSASARRRTLALIIGHRFSSPVVEPYASLTLPCLLPHNTSYPVKSFEDFLVDDDGESNGYFDILYQTELTQLARLKTAHLSGRLVTYLTDLLPNVNTLVVDHGECNDDELRSVIKLVGSWSLKIVKLFIQTLDTDWIYFDRPEHHPILTMIQCINQQSSLQQLNLDIDGTRGLAVPFPLDSFCFIARLKAVKLYLGLYGEDNLIWDILHRFDHTELRSIGLENDEIRMEDALNPKFKFTTKVNSVSKYCGYLCFETVEQFDKFCWRFPSLTSLRMVWSGHTTFTHLVTKLALLGQLTHLELKIKFEEHPDNPFTLVERFECNEKEEEEPRRMSLPQVKTLVLDISKRSHHHFESLSSLAFPSVEMIILCNSHGPCTTCRSVIDGVNDPEMVNRCHRMLILSLEDKFVNSVVRIEN